MGCFIFFETAFLMVFSEELGYEGRSVEALSL